MPDVKVKLSADGTWYARPYLGVDPVTGRPRRPYRQFPGAAGEEEAQAQADAWAAALSCETVSDGLAAYLAYVSAAGAPRSKGPRANTAKAYRSRARLVASEIGSVPLPGLAPADLTAMYRRLLEPPDAGGRGLAPSTVQQVHWFVQGALGWLVSQGALEANPAHDAAHPTASWAGGSGARAMDEATCSALVEACRGELAAPGRTARREAAFCALLCLATGMRVGEACALRRRDYSARACDVCVSGTVVVSGGARRQESPKGGRARRVSLPRSMAGLVEEHLAERPQDGPDAPVATIDGRFLSPQTVGRAWRELRAAHGLPAWVHMHTMRHTHATLALERGENEKVVQERLGHADIATTQRVYDHVRPDQDRRVADMFGWVAGE